MNKLSTRILVAAAVVTLGVHAAPRSAPAAPAAAQSAVVQKHGTYEIKNVNSGLNLGIYDEDFENGGKVAQWNDEVDPGYNFDQLWEMSTSGGVTELHNSWSSKVMAVASPRNDNWAKIIHWDHTDNPDQAWRLEDLRANVYQIRNIGSNKCLAIPNASRVRGTQAIQYTCNGGRDQKWKLQQLFPP